MAGKTLQTVFRFWPLLALFLVAAAAYALGANRELNFGSLAEHRQRLRSFVEAYPLLAPLAYMAIYTTAVACAVPGGLVLSSAAGVLFGTVAGGAYALLSITTGSLLLFLAARSTLRPMLERRAGRLIGRIAPTLEQHGFSYLLAIRLIPLTPFWLVNIAAALAGVRVAPYALATFLGLAPITFALASAGAGLSSTLDAGGQPGLAMLVPPTVWVPLLALAALTLVPVFATRRLAKRAQRRLEMGSEAGVRAVR